MAKKAEEKEDFNDIPRDMRAQAVREHMEAGGSNHSAAREFGSTVGAIAGIRRDYGIPSLHNVPSMGTSKKKAEPAPKPKQAPKPDVPGLIESRSEASRCEYKGGDCPYEAKPGTPFCPLHQES